MAMLIDHFVPKFIGVLVEFGKEEACKVLGVKKDIDNLRISIARIQPYVQDAARRRSREGAVNTLMLELRDVLYDAEDMVDLCMLKGGTLLDARPRISSSSSSPSPGRVSYNPITWLLHCCRCIKYRHKIASNIKALEARLEEILNDSTKLLIASTVVVPQAEQSPEAPLETSSIELGPGDIVGTQIEYASELLIDLILKSDRVPKIQLFGITGMGGIGKTTLARKIINDQRIQDNFPIRIWLDVTKNNDQVLKVLIRLAGGSTLDGPESREELEEQILSILRRNFILVLDNAWSARVWEDLLRPSVEKASRENAIASGRIIVTTRDERVARQTGASYIHDVKKMDKDSGWELLCKRVTEGGEEKAVASFKEIGFKIVEKCDGLPLAIKVIAGVLRSMGSDRMEHWEQVLESDVWHMKQVDEELPRALYLSYEVLPPYLKPCFLYCALYQSKDGFYKDLIQLWVAEGFILEEKNVLMEEKGEHYYKELLWRNLLQLNPEYAGHFRYLLHDHLRALGIHLMEGVGLSIRLEDDQPFPEIKILNPLTKIRRLSISNVEGSLTLAKEIMQQKCLRTLILFDSPKADKISKDVIEVLVRVRVLVLTDTSVESLPNSIGKLVHLRYLDMERTKIRSIPTSIGRLANLQTLNITECISLERLPNTLTRLQNLRCIRACENHLTHFPKGIGRLTRLNFIDGFVVGHRNSTEQEQEQEQGCDLEELQSLDKLRSLTLECLERAKPGAMTLESKRYLTELAFTWSPVDEDPSEEQIQRAELTCNELSPPSKLQFLAIRNFVGRRLPSWMMRSSLATCFPNLANLLLCKIPKCTELPPLGTLPQLKWLFVGWAMALKTIGPEFFGGETVAFPTLEYIKFMDLPHWEEWSASSTTRQLFPYLKEFLLSDCPKLRALPQSLLCHATRLEKMALHNNSSLREIRNLPLMTHQLQLKNNSSLQIISNLPSVRLMEVTDCPGLKLVENLDALQHLLVTCSPSVERLPQWLLGMFEDGAPNSAPRRFKKLEMFCGLTLLKSCLMGEENWHIIQKIPQVKMQTNSQESEDDRVFMMYCKDPLMYETNCGNIQ